MSDGGLRPLFRKFLPHVDWQPIETWSTGRGVPDVNFCVNGVEGWIENKQTSGWKVIIRPEQVAWAERRMRAGGRVFFAVRAQLQTKLTKRDELWLLNAACARELASGARLCDLPRLQEQGCPTVNVLAGSAAVLGHWEGGPAHWGWKAFGLAISAPAIGSL